MKASTADAASPDPLRIGQCTLGDVEDIAARLDAHVCTGSCAGFTHTEAVLVSPADVATVAAELGILADVRDRLVERGMVMLEGDPTPRFESDAAEPKSWSIRYESRVRAPSRRRGWFNRRS
jgi:hypothetical protein